MLVLATLLKANINNRSLLIGKKMHINCLEGPFLNYLFFSSCSYLVTISYVVVMQFMKLFQFCVKTCNIFCIQTFRCIHFQLLTHLKTQWKVQQIYLLQWLTTLKMKKNEILMKHVHNFKNVVKQLSMAKNPMKDEDAMFALI